MRLIKEYCCCAIPLLNVGIYTTLTEQFVVSVTAAVLALVTPPSTCPPFLLCGTRFIDYLSRGCLSTQLRPYCVRGTMLRGGSSAATRIHGRIQSTSCREWRDLSLTFHTGVNCHIPTLHYPTSIYRHSHICFLGSLHRYFWFKAQHSYNQLRGNFLSDRSYVRIFIIAASSISTHARIA
jgi:hypothetical protein